MIDDGLTGFLVTDEDQACAAVEAAARLKRGAIRKRFELRFSSAAMAKRYLACYRLLLNDAANDPSRGAEVRAQIA